MEVGLVLGGGGARGFAHIGVLRCLMERKVTPVTIAGCSMGGIIGALFAAGHRPDDIREIFDEVDTIRLLDVPKRGSLFGGMGVARELDKYLPETFADLNIPLAVTAVDVQEGVMVVLHEGALVPALRATSAFPGIFSPVDYEDRILIDGGVLNNVPIDVARTMTSRPIIAVSVAAPPNRRLAFHDSRSFWDRIKDPFVPGKRPLVIELFMKAFDIPASVITDVTLTIHRPEVLVKPDLDPDLKLEDYKRMDEAIEAGYAAATSALDQAGDALRPRSQLKKR